MKSLKLHVYAHYFLLETHRDAFVLPSLRARGGLYCPPLMEQLSCSKSDRIASATSSMAFIVVNETMDTTIAYSIIVTPLRLSPIRHLLCCLGMAPYSP